jgi:hypothetical protein
LHSLRKPYESGGKTYRFVALVCPACPATFTLADLGAKTYDQVARRAPALPTIVLAGWRQLTVRRLDWTVGVGRRTGDARSAAG